MKLIKAMKTISKYCKKSECKECPFVYPFDTENGYPCMLSDATFPDVWKNKYKQIEARKKAEEQRNEKKD